jgi:Uma2 family endonuclease
MHVVKSSPPRLYLTPADQGRSLSLAEFLSADSQAGYRYELIDGKLEVSPQPNKPHNLVGGWLGEQLKDYARERSEVINQVVWPARVFVPDRPETTAPEPDFAAYHGIPDEFDEDELDWQDASPILVVEILSPDSEEKDLVRNRELYLQVPSIREYWIIDPRLDSRRPSMIVYRRRGRRWQRPIRVAAGGSYATPLLPGFTLVLDRRKPA